MGEASDPRAMARRVMRVDGRHRFVPGYRTPPIAADDFRGTPAVPIGDPDPKRCRVCIRAEDHEVHEDVPDVEEPPPA